MRRVALIVLVLGFAASGEAAERTRLTFGYSTTGPTAVGLWMANEIGAFAKYGVEPNLVFISSSPVMVPALIGGDVQCAIAGANAVIAAAAGGAPNLIRLDRSFYGIYRVDRPQPGLHVLTSGTTIHGRQSFDGPLAGEPLSYYHRAGPLGEVIESLQAERPALRIGAVGLGAGAIAAYGRAGDSFRFFEIDPTVVRSGPIASLSPRARGGRPARAGGRPVRGRAGRSGPRVRAADAGRSRRLGPDPGPGLMAPHRPPPMPTTRSRS